MSKEGRRREWNGRTQGGNWGLQFLISLLGKMSVSGMYVLLDVVLPFYVPFNMRAFKATKDYFRKRLGYPPMESVRKAYATHRKFGQMMFDRFRLYTKGDSDYHIEVEGNDGIRERMDGGEAFVIAGSHVGSMEMAGYMLGLEDKPINAVVYGGETASLQKHRAEIMERHGVKMIPVNDDLSHIFQIKAALDRGEIVSMASDRRLGSDKYVECTFLGAPARFPVGAFILAAQTDKELVALFNMKEGKTGYKVYVKPITVDREGVVPRRIAEELLKGYVSELEKIVRKYPDQWFNFYDFWKLDA
ncbi:MAG: lipid A biosynthesis (KDO)2-(lauroyl)-lipid IVA acyltransferase [Candidatus Cryptobacteroides sp.]